MKVVRVGDGMYRVTHEGRTDLVYVAGAIDDAWAFCEGETYRVRDEEKTSTAAVRARRDARHSLTAPMPATVLKVLAHSGSPVRRGDAILILEAMKMELPIRAPSDAIVAAIHCREGDLVQPEAVLVELK